MDWTKHLSKLGVSLCSIANICIFWNLDLSNLLGRGVTPKQLFHTNSESPMNCTMSPPNEVLTFGLDVFHSHPFYIFMAYPSPCTFFTVKFRTLMSRLCCHATDRLLESVLIVWEYSSPLPTPLLQQLTWRWQSNFNVTIYSVISHGAWVSLDRMNSSVGTPSSLLLAQA